MRAASTFCVTLSLLALFAPAPEASANVGEAYGLGSRAAALGGAGVSSDLGGFSAYANPAALAADHGKRLTLNWGVLAMAPSFTAIDNVKTSNLVTSNSGATGSIDTSYKTTFGQELAFAYRLLPETLNLTLGLTMFLPLEQLAYVDTGPTLQPEYVLYRARTQRPQFDFGLGADLGAGFHAGVGLHIAYSLTTNAELVIQARTGSASSMRLSSSVKPKAAPYFGLYFQPESAHPAFTLGAVARLPVASANAIVVKNKSVLIGTTVDLDFNFGGFSSLYYDPLSFELGATLQEGDVGKLLLQLEYQAWGAFQAPAVTLDQTDLASCPSGCPTTIAPSLNPTYDYRDIVVPRIGQEFDLNGGRTQIRVGYAYRPSILGSLPTGNGNYLDPPKHQFSAGIGYRFNRFLGFDTPCTLDVHGAYHLLVSQRIDKTPGNESGNMADQKIGDPGYDAGGAVYGGGMSITLAF
jgi:hypothetical protein